MSLFQSIVIEKYVRELDNTQLETAWQTYSHCFLNLSKQDNIRLSKEEQYQEGFLRDLFVDVFGYTLNPNPDYNLTTEFKNRTGSKKVDGAILKDGHAIGVIELKGMNTTDLSKIEQQAFGYKNNQPKCRYVITSNFQKLRLYIDNAVEFIEFNLFTLTQEDFALLYLLLSRDSIMSDLPAKLKSASLSQEEAITKQLYKDYSVFKRELFNDLTGNNPSVDNLILFQKSQKLLDRLLFIFFAEDSHLLPANFAKGIISEWEQLKSLKMTVPLYDRIKAYFGYLDKGHKDEHSEIFAYNGGLFSTDELLDSVIISDDILQTHIKILSEYDFDSEVDVNILGHIFENSLTELDEVKAQLEGTAVDKSQTKRKKDGVFYTPKYITKYIVENTVGKLCTDKKLELGINEENYYQEVVINKDGTKKKKTDKQIAKEKVAFDNLNTYRDWLLQITICDPAVGSGAFLNEALNFLIAEHEYIVELETKLFGSGLAYPDIENSILENNLFGVDINEESVEIAKLSLWLRTAQPRRKLNNLNDNIQCGNSLIDDPAVAGEKAFNWQTAFPQVFAKGGFDVVIGNPPYVRAELLPQEHIAFYKEKYDLFNSSGDLFSYFYELGLRAMNPSGLFGFISNTFDKTTAGLTLRDYLATSSKILEYLDFTEVQIFEGATTYPVIVIASKVFESDNVFNYQKVPKSMQNNVQIEVLESVEVAQSSLDTSSWSFNDVGVVKILNKIKNNQTVREVYGKSYRGIITGLNSAYIIEQSKRDELIANDINNKEILEKIYEGKDLDKWTTPHINKYLVCVHNGYDEIESINVEKYSSIKEYLNDFSPQLEKRYDQGVTPYNLRNCAYQALFLKDKIIWSNLQNSNKFGFDDKGYVINAPACFLPTDDKVLLCVLNSSLVWKFLTSICVVRSGGYIEVKPQYFEQIPVPEIADKQRDSITQIADLMLSLNEQLQTLTSRFVRTLQRKFSIDKLSKKLENWHELSYKDFIKELSKKKIKMSLGDEAEWEEYFLAEQTKAQKLITEIERTDREIDQMVYKLYDLTDDEIAIIEAS